MQHGNYELRCIVHDDLLFKCMLCVESMVIYETAIIYKKYKYFHTGWL